MNSTSNIPLKPQKQTERRSNKPQKAPTRSNPNRTAQKHRHEEGQRPNRKTVKTKNLEHPCVSNHRKSHGEIESGKNRTQHLRKVLNRSDPSSGIKRHNMLDKSKIPRQKCALCKMCSFFNEESDFHVKNNRIRRPEAN